MPEGFNETYELVSNFVSFDRLMGITPTGWLILIVANIPVYIVLALVWFRDKDGFLEGIKYLATPDVISWFRGEYEDDRWARFKFLLWFVSCVACVYFEADFIRYMMSGTPE